ncbi:MAG: serine hydrolase domain-containing protein [Isosphaeraceae bacterium]
MKRSLISFLTAAGLLTPALLPGQSADTRPAGALQPFVDRHQLAGAVVLVATPERVLSVEAVGYSDVAAAVPMKTDAVFWIASMSKPITATALMMLVDEGRVALDDSVEKYLPEFRNQMLVVDRRRDRMVLQACPHPITIREILSHTSGLVTRSPLESELDVLPLKIGTITYGLSALQFAPGTKYEYCNAGINTAGRIIEVVSDVPYEEFLQKRLFDPLGMKDTTFWPDEAQVARLAKSYRPGPKNQGLEEIGITQLTYPLTDRSKRHPYPAGGLFSTASDLARFGQMIAHGGTFEGRRYVSERAVRAMTSTQTGKLLNNGRGEHGYGLGWSTSRYAKENDGPVIPGPCGHGGAYATNMSIDPGRGLITVYLVQHAGFPGVDGSKVQEAFQQAAIRAFGK